MAWHGDGVNNEPFWGLGAISSVSTDSEIVQRSVKDAHVFSELFERHARAVAGFAARRIGSQLAEDVVSETFLVAFRRRASFDTSHESARPWLFGIATRLIRKQRANEAKHWRSYLASAGAAQPDTTTDLDSVVDRLDASHVLKELGPRIAALSQRDRDTLLLFAWGDLTQEEIAQALKVPTGTVKSRLNRIRRLLAPEGALPGRVTPNHRQEVSDGRIRSGA